MTQTQKLALVAAFLTAITMGTVDAMPPKDRHDAALACVEVAGLGLKLDDGSTDLKYNYHVQLWDADGNLKDERIGHNTICTTGKDKLLAVSSPETVSQFAYLAIGTSSTAATSADTTIGAEVARSAVITPTFTSHTISFAATFAAGTGTGTIQECGLLDAASAGNLLSHIVFGAITKGSSDSLTVTVSIS